ncbi:hypothetical protein OsJ_15342 [Oryza sativa Japonica Group]|uniref:Uncharacterized protein n=1 Tax=Oryza sativa subsp. japonica TaxID=39947 RepID=B9FFY3_ORYSJ|nr:hypothetical protein OsJ_15342 [Oryza sativa Japonica Group]
MESAPASRVRREDVARAVAALLRWLQHQPTPAPEPIYLLVTLKRAPARRFEHTLRLPRSPFPSISLVSDRLPADLPDGGNGEAEDAKRKGVAVKEQGIVKRRKKSSSVSVGGDQL